MSINTLRRIGLIAAAFLLTGTAIGHAEVRISNDPGGQIGAYMQKYQGLRSSGERVVIDGFCASACTIVLGEIPYDRICVTAQASLGFHAAFDPDSDGRHITNLVATHFLYSIYPSPVRRWISRHGGLTPHMILLQGKELQAMYRPCD